MLYIRVDELDRAGLSSIVETLHVFAVKVRRTGCPERSNRRLVQNDGLGPLKLEHLFQYIRVVTLLRYKIGIFLIVPPGVVVAVADGEIVHYRIDPHSLTRPTRNMSN